MRMPQTLFDYFSLNGGLNIVSPPLSLPPGVCRDAINYEVGIDGGYNRIKGYERFSGLQEPSSATYVCIPCEITGDINIGDIVEGDTSAVNGKVIAVTENKVFVTQSGTGYLVGETLSISAVVVATISDSVLPSGGADSPALDARYLADSANVYRALIQKVPGSGPVRGVWLYAGTAYAFRDNEDASAARMYKSSNTGWQLVDLGFEIAFTNANTNVTDGDTLTQGINTATIARVVVESGTLQSGTNTGKLILKDISGAFTTGAATSTGGGSLSLFGASSAITLQPGGRYEFENYNFSGLSITKRMYGVNGVNRGWEFDGEVFVPIKTGLVDDKPSCLAAHVNYLFYGYQSSVLFSGIGAPYNFTDIAGGGEIAMGDDVTGFLSLTESQDTSALAVFSNNSTNVIYGSSKDTFVRKNLNKESGGKPRTKRIIGEGYVFDSLGVRQIAATQNFGNFTQAQITNPIRPFVLEKRSKAIGSCISRHKDQYRLFFNDGYVLHVTVNNQSISGIMPIKLDHTLACIESIETDDGDEYILGGGTDGYVYRFEKGTSFDGLPIDAYINLAFAYQKGPRIKKHFRKAVYEVTGQGYAEIECTFDLGYATSEIASPNLSYLNAPSNPVFWDSFTWDSFFWDGKSLLPIEHKLDGSAENISLILRSRSDAFQSYAVNSATIHYTPRRALR